MTLALGDAWILAEAALPPGWWMGLYRAAHKEGDVNPHTGIVLGPLPGPYVATAQPAWYSLGADDYPTVVGEGDTPAEALLALGGTLRMAVVL